MSEHLRRANEWEHTRTRFNQLSLQATALRGKITDVMIRVLEPTLIPRTHPNWSLPLHSPRSLHWTQWSSLILICWAHYQVRRLRRREKRLLHKLCRLSTSRAWWTWADTTRWSEKSWAASTWMTSRRLETTPSRRWSDSLRCLMSSLSSKSTIMKKLNNCQMVSSMTLLTWKTSTLEQRTRTATRTYSDETTVSKPSYQATTSRMPRSGPRTWGTLFESSSTFAPKRVSTSARTLPLTKSQQLMKLSKSC